MARRWPRGDRRAPLSRLCHRRTAGRRLVNIPTYGSADTTDVTGFSLVRAKALLSLSKGRRSSGRVTAPEWV